MTNFTDADEALAAALGDTPTVEQDTPADSEAGDSEAHTPADVDVDAEPGTDVTPAGEDALVPDEQWLCSADEARALADRARAAITELDTSLREIVERRAWEPLGYASPKEFVLAELGPGAPGGKSRAQAYRLARVAMFFYGLAEAFGEDSTLLDISERSLRAIPPGPNGENDEVLTERVGQRLAALSDPTEDQAQQVWDEEVTRARDEYQSTGRLSRDDSEGGWSGGGGGGGNGGGGWDNPQDEQYQDDDFDLSHITGGSTDSDDEDSEDEDSDDGKPEWETKGTSRLDFVDAYGVGESASNDTHAYLEALGTLMEALAAVAAASQHLPDIVEYATDEQITQAAQMAHTTKDMTDALVQAATDRDDGFSLSL